MNSGINVLDLFSGIGGFSLGFERAGFKIKNHYFSEVDKHAIAVYKHQFKKAKYAGSVETIRGSELEHQPNIITFGSPCQDFSLAGKRSGMEGQRSSLILHAIRLVRECRPDFFIWENVKGAFSSNSGADFWGILKAFANIGGYRLEWQLLNTAWVLPQNRERIYLVGNLAKSGRNFRQVFPFGESDEIFGASEGGMEGKREICSTITSNLHKGVYNGGETYIKYGNSQDQKIYYDSGPKREIQERDISAPLRANTGAGQIRRLTPIECCRLQGFPDDWNEYGDYDGEIKPISDTQRYKQCGNAVTVDIVAMIAQRIRENYY